MINNNKDHIPFIAVIFVLLIGMLSLGGRVIYLENNPIIETKTIYKPVYIEKVKEIEKIVEVEVISTVYVRDKEVVDTFTQTAISNKVYSITKEERDLLARLLYLEAGATSLDCQKKVASAIFNYWLSFKGTKTIKEVIYLKNVYSVASQIKYTIPKQEQYNVIDYILENGSVLPSYVRYFRNNYHHNWNGYVGYCNVDNVYFGYLSYEK